MYNICSVDDDDEEEAGDDGNEAGTGIDDNEIEDEALKYDEEGYGDEADREYLESLPQLQRESIVYDRKEKRQEALDRKAALQQQQPSSAKEKTRAAKAKPTKSTGRGTANDALADIMVCIANHST